MNCCTPLSLPDLMEARRAAFLTDECSNINDTKCTADEVKGMDVSDAMAVVLFAVALCRVLLHCTNRVIDQWNIKVSIRRATIPPPPPPPPPPPRTNYRRLGRCGGDKRGKQE